MKSIFIYIRLKVKLYLMKVFKCPKFKFYGSKPYHHFLFFAGKSFVCICDFYFHLDEEL